MDYLTKNIDWWWKNAIDWDYFNNAYYRLSYLVSLSLSHSILVTDSFFKEYT